jgi:hypothetical protein
MLIEYIYPDINKDLVFHGKNIGAYAISIFTVTSLYYEWNLTLLAYILTFHSIIDIPFSVTDIVVHHIFAIFGTIALILYGLGDDHINMLFTKLCWVESSTIFLCNGDTINYFLKIIDNQPYRKYNSFIKTILTIVKPINNLIFLALFMKLRIYDYTILVFDNRTFIASSIIKYRSYLWLKNINIIGLYGLNIYWCNLLIKKIYKMCLIDSDNDSLEKVMNNHTTIKNIFIGLYSYKWLCHIVNLGFFFRSPTILNELTVGYVLCTAYIIKPLYYRTTWLNYLIMIAYIMYFSMNFITEFISTQLTNHFNKNGAFLF